jgi:hypothetical protein
MASGALNGVRRQDDDSLALARSADGGYGSEGGVTSAVYPAPFAFDNLVLSWTADAPAGTGLTFDVRVQAAGDWSGWYTMGTWRDGRGASVRGQADAWAMVDTDTLDLNRPAEAWQYAWHSPPATLSSRRAFVRSRWWLPTVVRRQWDRR